MKKASKLVGIVLIFAFLLVVESNFLQAQNFGGGVQLGFNISQIDGDQRGGYSTIFPTGGLFAQTNFGNDNRAGVSLAITYIRKGSKQIKRSESGDISSIYATRLQYIELPVVFSWQLEKFKIPRLVDYTFRNKICFEVGLSYAYLLKAELNEGQDFMPPARAYNNYDIGFLLGLKYYIGEHFFVNYRFSYTMFFTPIRKHPGGQVRWFNRGAYNNVMMLLVGWEF